VVSRRQDVLIIMISLEAAGNNHNISGKEELLGLIPPVTAWWEVVFMGSQLPKANSRTIIMSTRANKSNKPLQMPRRFISRSNAVSLNCRAP
jgi:hypothetical protein